MKPNINQVVGYVAPPAKVGESVTIKKGVVMEVYGDGSAKIDITPRNNEGAAANPEKEPLGHHFAIAAFNSDKQTENSFHLLDEPVAAPAAAPAPRRNSGN